MDNYTVYMHISPSGKKYIGITGQSIERRWGNGSGYKNCISFNRAIEKYGWNNIEHEIIFNNLSKEDLYIEDNYVHAKIVVKGKSISGLSKKDAETKEIELIKKYNTTDSKYGYNIENGGSTIGKHSEETKRKIGIANKGKTYPERVGVPLSEEAKKKISDKNTFFCRKGLH